MVKIHRPKFYKIFTPSKPSLQLVGTGDNTLFVET